MDANSTSWHFLLNPAAGQGRAQRRWQKILPRLQAALPNMSWSESSRETGLSALAEASVRAGRTHLVGVGGDGTHHEILNGIVAAGGLWQVVYAPLPLGSGNDWVRTLGTPRRLKEWLAMLQQKNSLEHGVGALHYYPPAEKRERTRYFLNVAGMAYDAEVLRRAEKSPVKHRLIYPLLTLLFLRDFTAPTVRITYDDEVWEGAVHTINLGIGRYSGGGMRLVPQAAPTAKTLALTFAERLPLWKIIAESWRFYAGSVGQIKGVTLTKATSVSIQPLAEKLEIEADGEWLGHGPVTARLLEERLRVII